MAEFGPARLPFDLGLLSHGIATVAFLALTILLVASWKRQAMGAMLLTACIVTLSWAAFAAFDAASPLDLSRVVGVLELLRSTAWIGFVLIIVMRSWESGGAFTLRAILPWVIGGFCLFAVVLDVAGFVVGQAIIPGTGFDLAIFARLVVAVFGLLLVENLFSYTRPQNRWAIKYLCFGVGALFCYDFFMYSDAFLFQRVNASLYDARGVTNAVIAPLIAVSAARNRDWSFDVFVSRQVVFHSATLIGAGIYLLVMAGAGYFLRQFGGEWGPAVQVIFLFGAIVLLLVVSFSGRFRARLKVFINKHFFSYKYDYRGEWLRFIDTISTPGTSGGLPERVVEAVADIVDSPEGALWLRRDTDRFDFHASWNCSVPQGGNVSDPSFAAFLERQKWVVDLFEYADRPDLYDGMRVPDWLTSTGRAWLLIPLIHHDRLTGVLVLGRPRAMRSLNWEDYDLLKTVGRQTASYLAEQQAARALAESRQFDEFNRRFAFVIHDIKNLVSQLSLMNSNAETHRDNPEFQEDMLATVRESVEKMKRLMARLHEGGREAAATIPVDLVRMLRRVVDRASVGDRRVTFDCSLAAVPVLADEERLSAVMAHLLDNALEAVAGQSVVRVRLGFGGADAVIEIEDDGPGMTEKFVREEMFRPFVSTKSGGYGIGAYESREFVRELGGSLEVISVVGRGTTVRATLPTSAAAPQTATTREIAYVQ